MALFFIGVDFQPPIRHYTIGKEIVDLVLDRIRKLADNCTGRETASSVRFFFIFSILELPSFFWMLMLNHLLFGHDTQTNVAPP